MQKDSRSDYFQTSNPALSESTFDKYRAYGGTEVMTIAGTINRAGILLTLALGAALFTWIKFASHPQAAMGYVTGGFIVGLIFALITIFKANWSPITAPIYAIAQGLALGGISAAYEQQYNGIAFQAIFLTFGTAFGLLGAYKMHWVRATEKFRAGVMAATFGIFLVYLLTLVLQLFSVQVPFIHGNGLIGIGFSLFVVVIAALNLVLDFDFIERNAAEGAPKFMEWYAAFGLLVTLIWLYLEILRLLSKLRGRD